MKKRSSLWAGVLLGTFCGISTAADTAAVGPFTHAGLFANAKEVFPPLIADPHEIQLALRRVTPHGRKSSWDLDIGEYLGLYRWVLPGQDRYLQWSVAGGIFSRFDQFTLDKANQANDFEAAMPIDFRSGIWSARFFPYHITSRYGDTYIASTGGRPAEYSFNGLKFLAAVEPAEGARIYGGYQYIPHSRYSLGESAFQGGLELHGALWLQGRVRPYWAVDLQSWQRTGWYGTAANQLGLMIKRDAQDKSGISVYLEYGIGHRLFTQIFDDAQARWILGVRLEVP